MLINVTFIALESIKWWQTKKIYWNQSRSHNIFILLVTSGYGSHELNPDYEKPLEKVNEIFINTGRY